MFMEIIRLDVVEMETESPATMLSGMSCSVLLSRPAPTKKAPSLVPSSSSRPADILLPTWRHGRPAALDGHTISPLQQLIVAGAASSPEHALEVGVWRKLHVASHLSECCSIGVDFIPLVAETLGGLAKDTISTVRLIGKVLGQRVSPSDPSISTKHLFGQLAMSAAGSTVIHLFLPPS